MPSILFALLIIDLVVSKEDASFEDTFRMLRHKQSHSTGSSIVKETDVLYFLYTPTNREIATDFWIDQTSFNPNIPLKIIIHGFTESAAASWYGNIRREYFKKNNYNILEIDWSSKSRNTSYIDAVVATFHVGRHIGDFLVKLHRDNNLDFQNVHVVGHSLGSHVGSFAGNRVYDKTKMKVFRITGLDPAGPLFEIPMNNRNSWLDATDGEFVDVIHTDGGFLGFKASVGKADFFPNGGTSFQAGCDTMHFNVHEYTCSHKRSHDFFTESINHKAFATKCSSWDNFRSGICNDSIKVPFGEQATPENSGDFYFYTNSRTPFLVV